MKRFFVFLIIICKPFSGYNQDLKILNLGEKVVNQKKMGSLNLIKEYGNFETKSEHDEIVHTVSTSIKPDGVFQLSVKVPLLSKNIKSGQPLLISFKAKSIQSSLETNEAKVNWHFKQTASSSPKDVVSKSVSLSANWQDYFIPFRAIFSEDLDNTIFSIQFGYMPQVFELKDVELYVFPESTDFTQLPFTHISYAGMEENSQWRKEALTKIEENRKGDFSLAFYENGNPLSNRQIEFKQIKHFFRFGAAVSADEINNNSTYFETVKNLFNIVVFENDLKAKRWRNINERSTTLTAIDKLNENGIKVKGHVLLWPGFNYLPENYEKNRNNPIKIKKLIDENYHSILTATKGKISHWDVLNEAYTNKDISSIFGSDEILIDAFRRAKELDPKAKRFINEFGIISGGGINTKKQDWYFNFIKEIDIKTNGAIDGLGMQSHIGTDLTPPAKVIDILNRFEKLNKDISISEFSLDIMEDEDVRAKYTRDFMIATFSNSAVKEFLFWGFYAPMHPKVALVDQKYSLTKLGKAYYNLVFNEWTTKGIKNTNDLGLVSIRGFYGTYEYKLNHQGKIYKGIFEIIPGQSNELKINLQ